MRLTKKSMMKQTVWDEDNDKVKEINDETNDEEGTVRDEDNDKVKRETVWVSSMLMFPRRNAAECSVKGCSSVVV